MTGLVECVPNFSEGRRPEVLAALEDAVRSVPGVALLDAGMDPDHNRAVLTFCGSPDAVLEAAYAATRVATERIDLRRHRGVHPRIGATDVVPFVPIGETPMAVCVELAERFGQRVAEQLEIPVYLYEEAARAPERRRLSYLRRGGFEGLAEAIATDPLRAPDFGPRRLHPSAGALVTGARFFLIAYNIELATADLAVAETIARAIRESSGGLPAVRALGFPLAHRGTVQVSMNLTDYRRTSMGRVYERVRQLAARAGVEVVGSEVVGLVPREALVGAVGDALRIADFGPDRVLEHRLAHTLPCTRSICGFLGALASDAPAPGGGAAGALTGALAAATAEKVARLAGGEKGPEGNAPLAQLRAARWALLDAMDRDAAAYRRYVEARRLARDSEPERERRTAAMRTALREACEVPLEIMVQANAVLAALGTLAARVSRTLAPDVRAAAAMARAALESAGAMVESNAAGLSPHEASELRERARALAATALESERAVLAALEGRSAGSKGDGKRT